jgi:hypothetical protein
MYKYSRAKQLKTPHPVMVAGNTARQGTDQVRDYVFCQECENRFRMNGETWVLANIPHDYGESFPLHTLLNAVTPSIVESNRVLIPGRTTSGFDIDKLIYFGASMFWKGASYHARKDGGRKAGNSHDSTCKGDSGKSMVACGETNGRVGLAGANTERPR